MSDLAGELRAAAGSPLRELDFETTWRRAEQLGRRSRRARVGYAAALVVLALAVAGLALPQRDSDGLADSDVLPLPELGQALDAYLDDGTPVWVTRTRDGEVHVLNARSDNFHDWARHAYECPEPTLGSPWGSRFLADGTAVTGPAAEGLGRFAVVEVGTDSVRIDVTAEVVPAPYDPGAEGSYPRRCPLGTPAFPHAEWSEGFEEWYAHWYDDYR
jgi:hypothetical protein